MPLGLVPDWLPGGDLATCGGGGAAQSPAGTHLKRRRGLAAQPGLVPDGPPRMLWSERGVPQNSYTETESHSDGLKRGSFGKVTEGGALVKEARGVCPSVV